MNNYDTLLHHSRRPDLRVFANGRIDIAANIVHKLCLHTGDVIDVEVSHGEVFLFVKFRHDKVVGRHEGRCFATSIGDKGTFRLFSKRLAAALIRLSTGSNQTKELRLPCGKEQQAAFDGEVRIPIIIHNQL